MIRVYNFKRSGRIELAGKTFDFRIRSGYPKELSQEFLFVEFLNEYAGMAEEVRLHKSQLLLLLQHFNRRRIERIIKTFGKIQTRKTYDQLIAAISSRPS